MDLGGASYIHYSYTSTAVDPAGYVHISYGDPVGIFRYATNENGPWQTDVVYDVPTSVARENAIAIDPFSDEPELIARMAATHGTVLPAVLDGTLQGPESLSDSLVGDWVVRGCERQDGTSAIRFTRS